MAALKGGQVEAFLKKPDTGVSAALLYGADAGLVSERSAALAKHLSGLDNPPGEILRLDDADLEEDPGKLGVELMVVSMFGGRRIVRATAGRRINANLLRPILEHGALAGFLIVEAESLRADEALRTIFEKAPHAVALPCFADEARDIDALIRDVVAAAGLEITPDARQALASRLGADRALSRAEIDKVVLYAKGQQRIEIGDIEAIAGDAAELSLDSIIHLAVAGKGAEAISECDRCIASGENPQSIVSALQRYTLRLARVRAGVEAGKSMDDALRGLRPPAFYRQRDILIGHARQWDGVRVNRALSRIAAAARAARLAGALEAAHVERLLLEVARLASARPSGG